MVPLRLAVNPAAETALGQHLFVLRAPVRAVGPNAAARVPLVEDLLKDLAVVTGRIRHLVSANQTVGTVHTDVVLVAVVRHPVLLRPAGIHVLMATLPFRPREWNLAGFHLLVFFANVALRGSLYNACVNHLTFPGTVCP